jgi:protein-disulfide isomerase
LSDSSAGSSTIVASIVVGLSIVTAGFILKGSIDSAGAQLAAVAEQMQEANANLAAAPAGDDRPSPSRPSRPGRPDPGKEYSVEIGSAPKKGPDSAPVKIVEWSDFQCPFCRRANPTLAQIEQEYGDKVQLVFKHMPLSMHSKAPDAHKAAAAAGLQGKFWEMHDLIFSDQRAMSPEKYEEYAKQIGLDIDKFNQDRNSPQVEAILAADVAQASKLGITGTPAFFVNGRYLSGAQPFASFKVLIDEQLSN